MTRVYGHQDVVEHREGEPGPIKMPHEREVQAEAHGVLMAFAVVCARREKAAAVEVDVKSQFTHRGHKLSFEFVLVVSIYETVPGCEVLLNVPVDTCHHLVAYDGIDVGPLPRPVSLFLGGRLLRDAAALSGK